MPLSGRLCTKASNSAIEVPGTVFNVHSRRALSEAALEALVAVAVFWEASTPTPLLWVWDDEVEAAVGPWKIGLRAAEARLPALPVPIR